MTEEDRVWEALRKAWEPFVVLVGGLRQTDYHALDIEELSRQAEHALHAASIYRNMETLSRGRPVVGIEVFPYIALPPHSNEPAVELSLATVLLRLAEMLFLRGAFDPTPALRQLVDQRRALGAFHTENAKESRGESV